MSVPDVFARATELFRSSFSTGSIISPQCLHFFAVPTINSWQNGQRTLSSTAGEGRGCWIGGGGDAAEVNGESKVVSGGCVGTGPPSHASDGSSISGDTKVVGAGNSTTVEHFGHFALLPAQSSPPTIVFPHPEHFTRIAMSFAFAIIIANGGQPVKTCVLFDRADRSNHNCI